MNRASCAIATCGRKVLGPGRIALLDPKPRVRPQLLGAQQAEHDPLGFTTTQASQPAARTRWATAPSGSCSPQVGTSLRATSPARGCWALDPSVASPAASQSSLPAT